MATGPAFITGKKEERKAQQLSGMKPAAMTTSSSNLFKHRHLSPIPEVKESPEQKSTVNKAFQRLSIVTPLKDKVLTLSSSVNNQLKSVQQPLKLTPILEGLQNIKLQSSVRRLSEDVTTLHLRNKLSITPRRLVSSCKDDSEEGPEVAVGGGKFCFHNPLFYS